MAPPSREIRLIAFHWESSTKRAKEENIKIRISDFWAKGVAKSTKNQKLSPFGNVLQPVGFYDPIFGVI